MDTAGIWYGKLFPYQAVDKWTEISGLDFGYLYRVLVGFCE
jgi:hypothetical protein